MKWVARLTFLTALCLTVACKDKTPQEPPSNGTATKKNEADEKPKPKDERPKPKKAKAPEAPNPILSNGRHLNQWITRLSNHKADIRRASCKIIAELGPKANKAIPALCKALADEDDEVVANAARALGTMGPKAAMAIKPLIKILNGPYSDARLEATLALGRIGPEARSAVPALLKILRDKRARGHLQCLDALAGIRPGTPEVVKVLDTFRTSGDIYIRRSCCLALSQQGRAALPSLLSELHSDSARIPKDLVFRALRRFKDEQDVSQALIKVIKNLKRPSSIRLQAVRTLALIDKDTKISRPLFLQLREDKNPRFQLWAACALSRDESHREKSLKLLSDTLHGQHKMLSIYAMGPISALSKEGIPLFRKALKSKDSYTQEKMCQLLGQQGKDALAAVPDLMSVLETGKERVKLAALKALCEIQPEQDALIPILVKSIETGPWKVYSFAATTLQKLGPAAEPALPALAAMLLKDKSPVKIEALSNVLASMGLVALPSLMKALSAKNPAARKDAARGIGKMGPKAKAAVPKLLELLEDPEGTVRLSSADALGFLSPHSEAAIPKIFELYIKSNRYEKRAFARILENLGPKAIKALAAQVDGPPGEQQENAVEALGHIGAGAHYALPSLRSQLSSKEWKARERAIRALEQLGPNALPAILETLTDKSLDVRLQAFKSIAAMGPAAHKAVPKLIPFISGKRVSLNAADAVLKIGPKGLPALLQSYDKDPSYRLKILTIIREWGPRAKAATPTLCKAIMDPNPQIRKLALKALGTVPPKSSADLSKLERLLTDKDPDIRDLSAWVLGCMGIHAKAAVPSLIKALEDPSSNVRTRAATSLGRIGPAAAAAIPALKKAMNASDYGLRMNAKTALRRIQEKR